MKFEIVPYIGVGSLCWGMSCDEVSALIGIPDFTSKNSETGIFEMRKQYDMNCIYDASNSKLIEITFTSPGLFYFNDIDLFQKPYRKVVEALFQIDKTAVTGYGSIVFPAIGIALTGFVPLDSNKAGGAFSRGIWDISDMKPLKLR